MIKRSDPIGLIIACVGNSTGYKEQNYDKSK